MVARPPDRSPRPRDEPALPVPEPEVPTGRRRCGPASVERAAPVAPPGPGGEPPWDGRPDPERDHVARARSGSTAHVGGVGLALGVRLVEFRPRVGPTIAS